MKNIEDLLWLEFIDVYSQFDRWLVSIGFKSKKTSSYGDYHYSEYDKYIDSMYGIEHYYHNILNISIRFIRDKNEHRFMLVSANCLHSKVMTLTDFKDDILLEVKNLKEEQLNKLNSILVWKN